MRSLLLNHFFPFVLACGIAFLAIKLDDGRLLCTSDHVESEHETGYVKFGRRHFVDIANDPIQYNQFYDDWLPSKPILIVGSSELTASSYQSIPYHFFTTRGIPCVGMGSSGNQCLNITTQLMGMQEWLQEVKLVIVLSPGWFEKEYCSGTPLSNFLSANNESALYALNEGGSYDTATMIHIDNYVSANLESMDRPSSILSMMAYRSRSNSNLFKSNFYYPFFKIHEWYSDKKSDIMASQYAQGRSAWSFASKPIRYDSQAIFSSISFNWDSAISSEEKKFSAQCTNNSLMVEDGYYTDWLKGSPLKKITNVPSFSNVEFQDLHVLLSFLKRSRSKVLFVLQPFNPHCFENLELLDPTINAVRNEVRSNGFELLDLYTAKKSEYRKGILTDVHHMGELGWYMVDQKINQYFLNEPLK